MSKDATTHASPRPWRVDDSAAHERFGRKFVRIRDANGQSITVEGKGRLFAEDAALIVDAVNNYSPIPKTELLMDAVNENIALRDERDRLRAELDALKTSYNELHSELADKTRNYEDVIAFHRRTEESLRDIVRRLLPLAETTLENIRALGTARFPFLEQIKSDRLRGDINREVANADYLLREARAAIGEGEK